MYSNPNASDSAVETPVVKPFTRRTFMKTSALTIGAIAVLSQGRALAQGGGDSSSDSTKWIYALKCTQDPLDGGAEMIEVGTAFVKRNPTETFDPDGWGDAATYDSLIMGIGPFKDDDPTISIHVATTFIATVSSPGGGPLNAFNKFDHTGQADDSLTMTIDPETGHITYMPDPPAQKTGTGGQPNLQMWAQVSPSIQAGGMTQYQNGGEPGLVSSVEVGVATFNVPGATNNTITRPALTLDWTIKVVRKEPGGPWKSAPPEKQP